MTPVLPVAFQHTGAVSQMVNIGPFSFLMQVALVRVDDTGRIVGTPRGRRIRKSRAKPVVEAQ